MTPLLPVGLGLSPTTVTAAAPAVAPAASASGPGAVTQSFTDLLGQAVDAINGSQSAADAAANQLVTGQSTDIHSVMIAMEKAKVTFDLATQVRNKTLDAYNQLLQTQF